MVTDPLPHHELKMAFNNAFHTKVRKRYLIDLKFSEKHWCGKKQDFFLRDPNKIRPLREAREILDGWKAGTVWFERISARELSQIETARKRVAQVKPPRSDKGFCRETRPLTAVAAKWGRWRVRKTPKYVPDEVEMEEPEKAAAEERVDEIEESD